MSKRKRPKRQVGPQRCFIAKTGKLLKGIDALRYLNDRRRKKGLAHSIT